LRGRHGCPWRRIGGCSFVHPYADHCRCRDGLDRVSAVGDARGFARCRCDKTSSELVPLALAGGRLRQ
jgi:hypothetical protein